MDPLLPSNAELMDPDSDKDDKKKIQFSVPSAVPLQLDPRQVEMIRRRRPTPATLFRLTDPPSPDEDSSSHQWMLTDSGMLKSKNTMPYQPPSLKVVQKMAQAHLACLPSMDKDDSSDEEVDKESKNSCKDLINLDQPADSNYPTENRQHKEETQEEEGKSTGNFKNNIEKDEDVKDD